MSESMLLKEAPSFLFADLLRSGLACAFSSRYHGNMSLNYGDTRGVLENRKYFLAGMGIDYLDLVCAKQVHAASVRWVSWEDKGKGALSYDTAFSATDALITAEKDVPLAVCTADCLPLFLYDPRTPAIGLAHAGWRGTKDNIARKTLIAMKYAFGTKARNVYAGFGPAIRQCCYEVGEEFKDHFPGGCVERQGRHYLDLVAVNRKQLLDSGVNDMNMFDSGVCTSCENDDFFSYRKERAGCGRILSVLMLK